MNAAASAGLRGWRLAELALDRIATPTGNPLRHLGAVACLLLGLLALSGALLFVPFDSSVAGAPVSLAAWGFPGAVLRGVHRYAADALALTLVAHALREGLHGRFAHARRYTWLSGVLLLPLAGVAGVGGFWLGWDRLAQFSAVAAAEAIDALHLFATPLTRNFTSEAAVTDRLFTLLVFVHLGIALLIVFASWAHLQRLARPQVLPPRVLALGSTVALCALAAALPVFGVLPAQLAQAPTAVALDWWWLGWQPLMAATSPASVWLALALTLAMLMALPWLVTRPRAAVAQVQPANCNGCRRCFDDCPAEAITMTAHPLRAGRQLAVVNAAQCIACGICTGACPSSTPLRRTATLVTGIDMPQQPIDRQRDALRAGLGALQGGRRIVVFGCDHGAPVQALAAPDVAPLGFLCTAMLPPAFIDLALRDGADAVVVVACRDGGCEFRLGARWTRERLAREREPRLRAAVPAAAVTLIEAEREELPQVVAALDRIRRGAQPQEFS